MITTDDGGREILPPSPARHPFELWPVLGWLTAGLIVIGFGPGPTAPSSFLTNNVLYLLVLLMGLGGLLYVLGVFAPQFSRDAIMSPALELAALLAGAGSLLTYGIVILQVTPYGWKNFGFWWCTSLFMACIHRGIQVTKLLKRRTKRRPQ